LRCNNCHLPDCSGREQIPRLAGQREEYLLDSMRYFRDCLSRVK
jgi:cytochrome c553